MGRPGLPDAVIAAEDGRARRAAGGHRRHRARGRRAGGVGTRRGDAPAAHQQVGG
jgi:hypothetical protein